MSDQNRNRLADLGIIRAERFIVTVQTCLQHRVLVLMILELETRVAVPIALRIPRILRFCRVTAEVIIIGNITNDAVDFHLEFIGNLRTGTVHPHRLYTQRRSHHQGDGKRKLFLILHLNLSILS